MSQEAPDNTSANATSSEAPALAFRRARESRNEHKTFVTEGGIEIKYTRRSVEGLMREGAIPKALANKMLAMQSGQGGSARVQVDNLEDLDNIQRHVLEKCMVSPVLVPKGTEPNYEDNQIAYEDLDEIDAKALYSVCVGASKEQAERLNSFRPQPQS